MKKYTVNLTEGPLLSRIVRYCIPLVAALQLQIAFNAADFVVIGRFASDNSLAAVGSTGSLNTLLTTLLFGLSTGASVIASNFYGAKNFSMIKKTTHTAMTISLIGGTLLSIIGVTTAEFMLRLMNVPDDVLPKATLYTKILFSGMLFNTIYTFGSAILRATGDTKRPMYFLAFAGAVNLILNLIFVIVFKLDVAGVGIATAMSQAISAVLVWRALVKTTEIGGLSFKELRINAQLLKSILSIGIPTGFQGISFSLANIIIQSSINTFGSVAMAGNTAALTLEHFIATGSQGFQQTSISFTAQHIGAKKRERLIQSIKLNAVLSFFSVGLVSLVVIIFGKPLLGFFTTSPDVVSWGFKRVLSMFPFYCFGSLMNACTGTMRGSNHSTAAFFIILVFACIFRVIWIFYIFPMHRTLEMLLAAFPISWVLVTLFGYICVAYYLKHDKNINPNLN